MLSEKDISLYPDIKIKTVIKEAIRLIEEDTGIHFSKKQKNNIREIITTAPDGNHEFKMTKKQERRIKNIGHEKTIRIHEYAQSVLDGKRGNLADLVKKEIEKQDRKALIESKKRSKLINKGFVEVQNQIRQMYQSPLEKFKNLLHMGGEINDLIFARVISEELEKAYLYIALHRMHLQSQRISREIITLIESGYADGAMARWRTLHEYSVIAKFLKEKGNEAAERYLDFRYIERYTDAKRQSESRNPWNFDLATQEDIVRHEEKVNDLEEKYEGGFASKMGWAKPYFYGKSPNLFELEKEIEFDQYRPIVNLSHHTVHAGSQSLYFQLGQPPYAPGSIITGPSAYGIVDPLQFSVGSYYSISINLFIHMNSLDIGKHLTPFGDLYEETKDAINEAFDKYSDLK